MSARNAWRAALSEVTKRPDKVHQWPQSSPVHRPPPRFTRRSQLRFSPAPATQARWVARSLLKAHTLLRTGREDEALALCEAEANAPRESCLEFLHSAVSLFTRHGSFGHALALCNRMIDIGFVLPNKTFMLLLRGAHEQRSGFIEDVRDAMARGGVRMDDLSFKSVLDAMVVHGFAPEALEEMAEQYFKVQDSEWIPSLGIFRTIVGAWAATGAFSRANQWLQSSRKVYKATVKKGCDENAVRPESSHDETQPTGDGPQPSKDQARPLVDELRDVYAAFLQGIVASAKRPIGHTQVILNLMRQDGLSLNISMYNLFIRAFVRWGMLDQAFRTFEGLLRPNSTVVPDAYTFRHLLVALNPYRPRGAVRGSHQQALPEYVTARRVFSELIKVSRLRLRPRKQAAHRNLISTATFNCALTTFCAQNDYAAAWTILALFTWFHLTPDAKTSKIVARSLLRRMRREMSGAYRITDVIWMDRFSGERRSTMATRGTKMMLMDRLYMIGRISLAEMQQEGFNLYLRPSHAFDEQAAIELKFMIGLLRNALQAELGFQMMTTRVIESEKAIAKAMTAARHAMVPPGRSARN